VKRSKAEFAIVRMRAAQKAVITPSGELNPDIPGDRQATF